MTAHNRSPGTAGTREDRIRSPRRWTWRRRWTPIAEDVMAGYSPRHALQEFLRRGGRNREGLDDLAGRVQQRRQ